jgi:8-oxo-dGTP pyrophosphatase MutT (NUDIX family)
MWSIPGGILHEDEPPDAGAIREFEEETGQLLEELKFYRVYRRDPDLPTSLTDVFHIYYIDADLDEDAIEVNEGQAFRYFAPDQLAALNIPQHTRKVLEDFVTSPAYRGMFH